MPQKMIRNPRPGSNAHKLLKMANGTYTWLMMQPCRHGIGGC